MKTRLTEIWDWIVGMLWVCRYRLGSARAALSRQWWLTRRRLRGPGQQSTISVFRNGDYERLQFGALIKIDEGRKTEYLRVIRTDVGGDYVTLTVEAS